MQPCKKLIFLAIGIITLNCSASSLPKGSLELISSRHAELKLVEEKTGEFSSKKMFFKDSLIFESEVGKTFHLYQSLQLKDEDILVFLSEKATGNCVKFFIASIQKGPEIEILPEMGNCHDTPEITQENGQITFHFPSTPTEISQTVVYKNQKIEVTESKVSKK
jgi:hypothetical protein